MQCNCIFREMSSNSSEILLEVWDQGQKIGKSDIFLGLGIGKKKKYRYLSFFCRLFLLHF